MMYRNGLLKLAQTILLLMISAVPLAALDVIYLKNGDVIIGTLVGPVEGGISYKFFGGQKTFPLSEIDITEKNLDNLAKKTVHVVLKDDSTIQGKIVDYDEDIGVFLDISFGTLTIPTVSIKRIFDKEKSSKYMGAAYQISGFGGMYFPLGAPSEFFGFSWCAGVGVDWAIEQVRGLSASAKITLYGMDYMPDDSIAYTMISLRPEANYKYLGWRVGEGFLSKIVPYASAGMGLVYIAINDPASYPASYGNITADIALSAGIEYAVMEGIVADLSSTGSIIFQNGSPFFAVGVMLGISYEQ